MSTIGLIIGYLFLGISTALAYYEEVENSITFIVIIVFFPCLIAFGFTIKLIRALAVLNYDFLGGKHR